VAVDEYRFQVELNWKRTQYYLVLNVGALGIATGILAEADTAAATLLAGGLYAVGATCCLLALAANASQKRYYQATRNHMKELAEDLGLGRYELRTTPGMGSTLRRFGKVTTFINVILVLIAVGAASGFGLSVGLWFTEGHSFREITIRTLSGSLAG